MHDEESLRFLPVLTFFPFDSNPGLSQLCRGVANTALRPLAPSRGLLAEGEAWVGSQVLELDRAEVSPLSVCGGRGGRQLCGLT